MAYEGMADRRKIHSRIIANSINNESDFNYTAVVARNQKLLCYLGLGHGLPYFVTDASQLDAGSEVDVTEEWLSTAHPSQHSPDWSAEDGQPLPRLPDICYPVDMADEFRPTSVPLLTSVLWVAVVDDGAFSLFTSPSHQRSICQFLKPDENFTERFRQWLDR